MTLNHLSDVSHEEPRLGDDDATRHLSAAVHAHDDFADELIEEFLAEPRRAVPPSPGIDPVAVLSEALATRRRQLLRDSLAVGLFAVVLVAWSWLAVPWLTTVGAGVIAYSVVRRRSRRNGRERLGGAGWVLILFLANLGWLAGSAVAAFGSFVSDGMSPLGGFDSSGYYGTYPYGDYAGYDPGALSDNSAAGWFVIGLLASIGLLGVLLADRLWVHNMLTSRFAPNRYRAEQHVSTSPSDARYTDRLNHIARATATSNTLVHDGYDPFVGAGDRVRAWSIAIPLRTVDGAAVRLGRADVHAGVREAVLALRDSPALSPGGRLKELQESQEVITSADALLQHVDDPIGRAILPDTGAPPNNLLAPELVGEIVQNSPEWVRPYLCFRVDGWGKDLVVSTYLHVACDDTMLYLEWKAYVLNPIKPEFRYEELTLVRRGYAVAQGVADAVLIPATLGRRVLRLWRAARRARGATGGGDHYELPRKYGAHRSIRELAADDVGATYFHDEDSVRYVKLLERRTLAAVGQTLSTHGVETDEFRSQTSTVVHSTVINGGTFSGVNVVGQGNHTKTSGAPGERK